MTRVLKRNLLLVSVLVLVGQGCLQPPVSGISPKSAAEELGLSAGTELVLRQTVFGVGGFFVKWLGGDSTERTLVLKEWTPNKSASIEWQTQEEIETQESLDAYAAYRETVQNTPIGEPLPERPQREYKQVIYKGSLSTNSLDSATSLMLPASWPEGSAGFIQNNSLLWLSKEQYDELVSTRKTTLSLGLFDESILSAVKFTEQFRGMLDSFSKQPAEVAESEEFLTVNASGDWGSYLLSINGNRTRVRTIEAQNWFASFTILANPYNPIILEIKLTPASKGSLNIFSKEKLLNGFLGYEVVSITQNDASSAGQPQH